MSSCDCFLEDFVAMVHVIFLSYVYIYMYHEYICMFAKSEGVVDSGAKLPRLARVWRPLRQTLNLVGCG